MPVLGGAGTAHQRPPSYTVIRERGNPAGKRGRLPQGTFQNKPAESFHHWSWPKRWRVWECLQERQPGGLVLGTGGSKSLAPGLTLKGPNSEGVGRGPGAGHLQLEGTHRGGSTEQDFQRKRLVEGVLRYEEEFTRRTLQAQRLSLGEGVPTLMKRWPWKAGVSLEIMQAPGAAENTWCVPGS